MSDQESLPEGQDRGDAPLQRASSLPGGDADGGHHRGSGRSNDATEGGGPLDGQADVAAVVRLLQETLPRLSSSYQPPTTMPESSTAMPLPPPLPPPPRVSSSSSVPFTLLTADSIARASPCLSTSGPSPALPHHCQPFPPAFGRPFPRGRPDFQPSFQGFPRASPQRKSPGDRQTLFYGSCPPLEESSPLLLPPKKSDRSAFGGVSATPVYGTVEAPFGSTDTAHCLESNGEGSTWRGSSCFRFSRKQLLSLASMLMVDFSAFASISIMAPFFPHQALEMGVSSTLVGVIFSVYSLTVVVASPIIGKILPLLRVRDLYLVGITITGIANICFGFVAYLHDPDVFAVVSISLRVLAAFGAACFLTVIYGLVPVLFPNDMNTVNGTLETGIGLGMCMGPAVGTWLYSMGGFCLPFCSLGSLVLLTVPVSYFIFPDNETAVPPPDGDADGDVKRLLCRPEAALPLLILCSTAACVASLYPTLQPHMSRLGVSVEGAGLVYLTLSAVCASASPLVGLAADRCFGVPPSGLLLLGLLLTALSCVLIGSSPLLPRLPINELYNQDMMGIVVLGLASAMCIVPTYGAVLQAVVSQGEMTNIATFSMVGGLWSAAYSLGEMLGPLYAGVANSYVSFATSTTFTALLPLSLAVVLGANMCSNRLYS